MKQAFLFLVHAVVDFYIIVVMLRFLLQYFRADFRNPLAQAILQLTSGLVVPARKILPPIGKIDTATLAVALVLEVLFIAFLSWFIPLDLSIPEFFAYGLLRTLLLLLRTLTFVVIIYVVLSWISNTHNPATTLISAIAEPVLRPIRRYMPLIGGLDLSPMVAILLLMAVNILVGQNLPGALG